MEPYVQTRWTTDGLVQVTMDAATAQKVHHALRLDRVDEVEAVQRALGYTLSKGKQS